MSTEQTTPALGDMSLADYRAQREGSAAAATPAAPDTTPTSGSPELEEAAATTGDAEEISTEHHGDDDRPAADDAEGKTAKKKGGFQRKIDRLEAENAELKRRLAGGEKQPPAAAPAEEKTGDDPGEALAPPPADAYPKPKPKLEDFDSLEAFTEALTDWRMDEREWKREQAATAERERQAVEQIAKGFQAREQEAEKRYPDYREKLSAVDDVKLPPSHARLLLESEAGPDIAYKLAQDRAELERFTQLSPIQAAKAVAKLEAAFESPAPQEEEQPRVSKAPPPIRPVASKSTSAAVDVKTASLADYRRAREAGRLR